MPHSLQGPKPAQPVNDDDLLASAIPITPEDDEGSDDDAIELEEVPAQVQGPGDTDAPRVAASAKVRTFHDMTHVSAHAWKRKVNANGTGAIRVKSFIAKLRPESIEHMDEQVNQWLDEHPGYEVKHVSTAIGTLVGKNPEDALFVNVWY